MEFKNYRAFGSLILNEESEIASKRICEYYLEDVVNNTGLIGEIVTEPILLGIVREIIFDIVEDKRATTGLEKEALRLIKQIEVSEI